MQPDDDEISGGGLREAAGLHLRREAREMG